MLKLMHFAKILVLFVRSLVFFLGMLIITPIFATLAILLFPVNNVTRSRIASGGWSRCTLFWLKLTCNLAYVVRGLENIPNQPSIVLCKHQSAWETIALQAIFPPQIWVMKRELLLIPFLGWAFIALSAIPINRSSGARGPKATGYARQR